MCCVVTRDHHGETETLANICELISCTRVLMATPKCYTDFELCWLVSYIGLHILLSPANGDLLDFRISYIKTR